MRILLIDIDSKIPNLALMKLSAWHKKQGDEVFFNYHLCDPEKVYVSCIFTKNAYIVKKLPFRNIEVGGSGWNLKKRLPNDIEWIRPDYSLYEIDYGMGYTTRGCNRKCPWCVVPKKEGRLRFHQHPVHFLNPKSNKLILLDNNFTAYEHRIEMMDWMIFNDLRVDFNQGLDIRLVDDLFANCLARLKPLNRWHFAWDRLKDEKKVREGIKLLKKAGIKPSRLMFYVLCNFNTSLEEDLYRIKTLRGLKVDPFVMNYAQFDESENKPIDRIHREMSHWCNVYRFRNMPFKKWLKLRGIK